MSLTVLSVAFPFAALGPRAVGGAEHVLGWIDAALVARGHRSIVVARADSKVRGILLGTPAADGFVSDDQKRAVWQRHRDAVMRAMAEFEPDVVHMHGVDFHAYLPPEGDTPVLVTLHLPPSWYPREVFTMRRADLSLHCVSRSQHAQCPASPHLMPPIANGVPVRPARPRVGRGDFVLGLGRVCAEKNWHAALDAARLARVPMVLAGQVFGYPAHLDYFETQVRPRLDADRRFVGALGPRTKHRLLCRARCVVVPSLAPETSSLVAMEALACGTPVVAYPSGALPEIVEDGVTGFLVRTPKQMADAIARCDSIDPARCHAAARERFRIERTVGRYVDVYRQLAANPVT
jgi:glycosyltransferase involved in cell wall biosynthesis